MSKASTTHHESGEDGQVGADPRDERPSKTITFTELAAMAQVDEGILLRRLAVLLGKRDRVSDSDGEKE